MLPRVKRRRRSELGLLLVGFVVVAFAYVLASLGTYNQLPPHALEFLAVSAALALIVHFANRWLVPEADPVIMPVVLVLNGIGYVMLYRLDAYPLVGVNAPVTYQAAWTALGVVAYITTLAVVRRSKDLERYRYLLAIGALVMLVLPLAPYLRNSPDNLTGVHLWIRLGPISFQPVEIAKLMLVVFFASYLVEKREMLSVATRRVGNRMLPDLRPFGPIAIAWVASMVVILLEKDIGFPLLLFVVFIGMMWVTTGRAIYVVLGIVAFVAGTFLASRLPFAKSLIDIRVANWLNPWPHPLTTGLQPIQGELAIARGGLAGTGLGLGNPGVIPVVYSDYILAAIGEELGLLGATAVVVGFLLLIGSGARAALRARNEFSKMAALGFTLILGFQSFFIMAGVLRLLPLTGVTLPFMSYGGSSLIANYVLVALLMRISDEGATLPGPTSGATSRARRARGRADKRAQRAAANLESPSVTTQAGTETVTSLASGQTATADGSTGLLSSLQPDRSRLEQAPPAQP